MHGVNNNSDTLSHMFWSLCQLLSVKVSYCILCYLEVLIIWMCFVINLKSRCFLMFWKLGTFWEYIKNKKFEVAMKCQICTNDIGEAHQCKALQE